MGPQLFSYGNIENHLSGIIQEFTSMGPQLFSYGNITGYDKKYPVNLLQWGHNFSVMEITCGYSHY